MFYYAPYFFELSGDLASYFDFLHVAPLNLVYTHLFLYEGANVLLMLIPIASSGLA